MSFRLIFRDFCLVLCVTLTLQQKEREYDGTLIGPSINYLLSSKISLHSQTVSDKVQPSAS